MDSLKRNSMLGLGILLLVITLLSGCGSKSSPPTTTYSSPPSTTTAPPTTTIPPTTTPPPTTTQAAFPYQGSGSGTWSGQIIYSGTTYNISGTMIVACDSKGVFTGTIISSLGDVNTSITAQVDSNGNLTGSVSFVVASIPVVTTWQGKMTVSGTALSMQGTWTSLYGSGTFSGTGTSSK